MRKIIDSGTINRVGTRESMLWHREAFLDSEILPRRVASGSGRGSRGQWLSADLLQTGSCLGGRTASKLSDASRNR